MTKITENTIEEFAMGDYSFHASEILFNITNKPM